MNYFLKKKREKNWHEYYKFERKKKNSFFFLFVREINLHSNEINTRKLNFKRSKEFSTL
jgi:hypothetical protein